MIAEQIQPFNPQNYKLEQKISESQFSQVYKGFSLKENKYVAIKIIKKKYKNLNKALKNTQIQALKLLSDHQNILKLIQILYQEEQCKLALVFQFMEQNLYQFLTTTPALSRQKIKYCMFETLKTIAYIHKKGIIKRNLYPQNILITGDKIKLSDFASSKGIFTHNIKGFVSQHPFTQYISSRWYRAPQCLMTDGYYDFKMDIWAFGCILFQAFTNYPLFPGKSQLDQINRINKVIGSPSEQLLNRFKSKATHMKTEDWCFKQTNGIGFQKLLPDTLPQLIDLSKKLLQYDPQKRISAQQGLNHKFFAQFNEGKQMMTQNIQIDKKIENY